MTKPDITIDHSVIQRWIEDRHGQPAVYEPGGALRIDFAGYSTGEALQPLDWETFYRRFESAGLAFLHQDRLTDGSTSHFYQFVSRN